MVVHLMKAMAAWVFSCHIILLMRTVPTHLKSFKIHVELIRVSRSKYPYASGFPRSTYLPNGTEVQHHAITID